MAEAGSTDLTEETQPAPGRDGGEAAAPRGGRSVGRSAAIMSVGTSLSRVTGYLRVAALAYALGVSRLADSYQLANVMPNMVFELVVGGILSSVMIPVFMEYLVAKKREEAWYVASAVTNISLLGLVALSLLAIAWPAPFVASQTFLVGAGADTELVTFFFRFFVVQIVFYGIAYMATAMLNAHRRFAAPAFAPIANNITVIATVLFLFAPVYPSRPDLGLILLALGTTAGVAAMALVQVPSLVRLGMRYYPVLGLSHPAVRKIGWLALPVFFYVLLNQIGLTVANNLAYQFPGGVAALQYAWPLFHIAYGLFSVSITSALFPNLSEHSAKKDWTGFKHDFSLGLRANGFLLFPAAAGLIAAGEPIVRLLLEHGSFDPQATRLTAPILEYYALGLFSYGAWVYLTRVFYALEDTATPTWVNGAGVPVSVAANLALVQVMGVKGIALAHALTYTFVTGLGVLSLRRKMGSLDGKAILAALGRQVAAATGMGLVVALVAAGMGSIVDEGLLWGQLVQVAVALAVGMAAYIGFCVALGVRELEFVRGLLRRAPGGKSLAKGV